jgi:hypothetical protein
MCISEWIIEEAGFHTTYQVPRELFFTHTAEHLDFAENFSPRAQAGSITDLLVAEAEIDIAA